MVVFVFTAVFVFTDAFAFADATLLATMFVFVGMSVFTDLLMEVPPSPRVSTLPPKDPNTLSHPKTDPLEDSCTPSPEDWSPLPLEDWSHTPSAMSFRDSQNESILEPRDINGMT